MPGLGSFGVVVLGNSSAPANATSLDLVNGDVQARVAVKGGVRLRSFGVAQGIQCNAQAAAGFGLIVQGPGALDFANGQLGCGNLLVSEDVDVISLPGFVGNGGLVVSWTYSVVLQSRIDIDSSL